MTDAPQEAVHTEPVWRERSNFILGVRLPRDGATEQLWARQLADRQFELCCLPFFAHDLALGDVVETDDDYNVLRVVVPSGRFVFRVWFGESLHPHQEVAEALSQIGTLLEWSSLNLLAVDAVDEEHAQLVADFLLTQEALGRLVFDTGRTA